MELHHAGYILIDGATAGLGIQELSQRCPAASSLYSMEAQPQLLAVSPYLAPLNAPPGLLTHSWIKVMWGYSTGLLLASRHPIASLRNHLRQFLLVKDEANRQLYFRFYDPRVLRIFLPTCDAAQIREFFGNAIDYFICEDEDPDYALRFSQQNGILQTERFFVKDEIAALPAPEPVPPQPEEPLPPETIAALKEQGIFLPGMEPVAAQETPVIPQKVPVIPQKALPEPPPIPKPAEINPPPPPPPKTKWNTFD